MTKRAFRAEWAGVRRRGRSRRRKKDGVREFTGSWGFSFEDCERLARGRSHWKMIMFLGRDVENVSGN